MKKFIALLLIVVLTLGCFAGCTEEEKDPNAKLRIGVLGMSVESPTFKATDLAMKTIAKAADVELIKGEMTSYGDEGFLSAYESMIAQGVDGAVVYTFSEAVMPLIANMLEDANVKYFLANRRVVSEDVKKQIFSNPNFVGNDYCDETQVAYDLVEYLNKKHGVKNLAVIGLQKGDVNGDLRDIGIEKACKDLGINILTETRGVTTVEDVTNAVNGLIGAYPEMDGIFIVGGAVTPGGLAGVNQALINHKKGDSVKVAMVDTERGMGEFMDDGPLKIVAGGNLILDQLLSFVALVNELKGTPLAEEGYILKTKMLYITSTQEASDYDNHYESGTEPFFTPEDYKKFFFKFENPDVTLESINEFIKNITIESIKTKSYR